MRALLTAAVVALLVPGCFLDRSALGGPGADGGQPPDIDAAGVDAFVPRIDAGPNDGGGPVCVPSSAVDLCDGEDDDCDPATSDGSGEATFGEPCDGADMGACNEGTMVCDGTGLRCSDTSGDDVEICNGLDDDCDGEIDQGDVCPCEHDTFGGHSYLFCTDTVQWGTARTSCPSGYQLARIDSREEQDAIVAVAHGIAAGDWWFGGSAVAEPPPATWRWVIGGDPMPLQGNTELFSNWSGSDPNSTTECLQVDTNATGTAGVAGRWEDENCGSTRRYVCESVAAP